MMAKDHRNRSGVNGSYMAGLLLAVLSFPIGGVWSWIPQRPSNNGVEDDLSVVWESVQAMRKRLGIHYNYTPSLLHPEMCRYMNEMECEEVDVSMQLHAQATQRHQQEQQRALQSVVGDNINVGTIKVLVLLIQFEDHLEDRQLIDKETVEKLWNGDVKRWFEENSQGAYQVEPVVVDWVVTDNTEEYYSFDSQGIRPELQRAMHPALDQLDATEGWDWSQFDSDGNGAMDGVVMMHSGFEVTSNDADCKGREPSQRIRPHAFITSGNEGWTSSDGSIKLSAYAVASVYEGGFCDGIPFTPGLLCHEYMHTIGLIDLYDTNPNFDDHGDGIGRWDPMSDPYGFDNSGNPPFLSAWSRQEANWLQPERITYDGYYTLKPSETSNQAYAIYLIEDPNFEEYLLIENRQPISFDEKVFGKGLIIYHIDNDKNGQEQRGYPGQDDWPKNGNHYQVALLPKDGRYDLEQNFNLGDAEDLWLPGDALGPGKDGTVFPNTDLYQAGFIEESGITVRVVSQEPNNDVVLEVTGLAPAPADATNQDPPPPSSAAEEGDASAAEPSNTEEEEGPSPVDPETPENPEETDPAAGEEEPEPATPEEPEDSEATIVTTNEGIGPSSTTTSTPPTVSPTPAETIVATPVPADEPITTSPPTPAAEPTSAQTTTTTTPPAPSPSPPQADIPGSFHAASHVFEAQPLAGISSGFASFVVTSKWRTVWIVSSALSCALAWFPV